MFGITRTSRRHDHAGRQADRAEIGGRRRSKPASSMCRRSAASRASSSACRSSRTSRCPRSNARRKSGVLQARRGVRAGPRLHRAARPARLLAQPGCRHAVGRQPAEGGHRQMAGDRAEGDHPRRADQGHRHRLEGRRARLHGRTRRARAVGDHGVVRTARDPRHVRPRRRHARGPHRRRSTTTRGSTPRRWCRTAAGIAA